MFNRSLESITSQFNKTIKDLDALTARNAEQIDHHKSQVEFHAGAHANLAAENERAAGIRARVAALVA